MKNIISSLYSQLITLDHLMLTEGLLFHTVLLIKEREYNLCSRDRIHLSQANKASRIVKNQLFIIRLLSLLCSFSLSILLDNCLRKKNCSNKFLSTMIHLSFLINSHNDVHSLRSWVILSADQNSPTHAHTHTHSHHALRYHHHDSRFHAIWLVVDRV